MLLVLFVLATYMYMHNIIIQVKLSANDPDNPVTVFNNNVSLNQQDMDCNGELKIKHVRAYTINCALHQYYSSAKSSHKGSFFTGTISPPSSCDSPTTTTSTTARRTTTIKMNTRMDYKNIYIPIICIFLLVLAVLAAVGTLAIVYYLWKKK